VSRALRSVTVARVPAPGPLAPGSAVTFQPVGARHRL